MNFKNELIEAEMNGDGNTIDITLFGVLGECHASYDTYYLQNEGIKSELINLDDYTDINDFDIDDVGLNTSDISKLLRTALNRKIGDIYCGVEGKITLNGTKYTYEVKLCDCY